MKKEKLLKPIDTMPYDELVGIVMDSCHVVTGFWKDCDFEYWIKKHTSLSNGDCPKYWFSLFDLQKAFKEE